MYLFIAQTSNGEIRGQFLFDTARKVAKYGVISGPYFPVFGLNAGKYGPEKTAFGHFSRSEKVMYKIFIEENYSQDSMIIN